MRKLLTTALVALTVLAGGGCTAGLQNQPQDTLPACKMAFTEIEGILTAVVNHLDLKDKSNAEQLDILDGLIDLMENSDYDALKAKCLGGSS